MRWCRGLGHGNPLAGLTDAPDNLPHSGSAKTVKVELSVEPLWGKSLAEADKVGNASETRGSTFVIVALVLATAALLQPFLAWAVNPQWAVGLAATMAAELVTGRETAIPLALDRGVPPAWIATTSILQNLAMAALVVPLVLAAIRRAEHHAGFSGRLLRRLHAAAEAQRHKAGSAWGIFLFMLVPFLANGPIIAGVLGRLIGIDAGRLALAIVAAVILTATSWSFAHSALTDVLARVNPRLARVPAMLALIVAAWTVARLAWSLRTRGPA
jgi:hypothetical protein